MEPNWEHVRQGHWNQLVSTIRHSLGQFYRRNDLIKIGATQNPEQRWSTYSIDGWREMVVLWETTSYDQIKSAEKEAIDWAWEYDGLENDRGGGAGLRRGADRYFLYAVLE